MLGTCGWIWVQFAAPKFRPKLAMLSIVATVTAEVQLRPIIPLALVGGCHLDDPLRRSASCPGWVGHRENCGEVAASQAIPASLESCSSENLSVHSVLNITPFCSLSQF